MASIPVSEKVVVGFKLISSVDYAQLVDEGKVDPNVYYFVYESSTES